MVEKLVLRRIFFFFILHPSFAFDSAIDKVMLAAFNQLSVHVWSKPCVVFSLRDMFFHLAPRDIGGEGGV